ncbi:MAG: GNAT family N-acetyltransferase [Gammaproteobacteria bacterium]|nr:GNAT family N-acetyltransferase [Gammaproteobacteria bacterium]
MEIYITSAKISDQIEIDSFLRDAKFSVPYQHLQWLLAIHKAYGHRYEYLLARRNNSLVGVLPVSIFRNFFGKKQFCSLPFCDVGGVVADDAIVNDKLIRFALDRGVQLQTKSLELRQRLMEEPANVDMTDRKVSMLLDLPESAEALLAGFKSKLRSQIKKAEKNGLIFDFSSDKKSIDDFYYVFCRNMHLLGSPTHSIKWFHTLREMYQDNLLVGRVWFEGQIVGAGILLFSGNNVSIPWASTLRDYNRLAPNMLLYWNLLRVSCDRGCKQFDFGRSTYGEGTYKFKKQWGAKPVLLDWQTLDVQGVVVETGGIKGRGREMVEAVWKKLPLSVVNTIGPRLRKHISL